MVFFLSVEQENLITCWQVDMTDQNQVLLLKKKALRNNFVVLKDYSWLSRAKPEGKSLKQSVWSIQGSYTNHLGISTTLILSHFVQSGQHDIEKRHYKYLDKVTAQSEISFQCLECAGLVSFLLDRWNSVNAHIFYEWPRIMFHNHNGLGVLLVSRLRRRH